LNSKWVAYTVGIDNEYNYVVKIDTAGENDKSVLRKKYVEVRGDFYDPKIVKLHNSIQKIHESIAKMMKGKLVDYFTLV
jgi:hypothetical protein